MMGHTIAPVNLLFQRKSSCKFTNCPNSTGIVPAICGKCNLNLDALAVMYDGTYNRTCEAIALQHELFQIDEVAELLGQLSCNTQVNVSKHTIHVCWDIQLASDRVA